MTVSMPDAWANSAHVIVVGEGDSDLASGLRDCGHDVLELQPSDFHSELDRLADVVAILPDCPDASRVGAVAAACARMVWFQRAAAPDGISALLAAAGVPTVEAQDLLAECES
jgi:hypothetical protein